ncbi:Aminoglycoside phosphotransferase [Gammaproteobacteria bacterium]
MDLTHLPPLVRALLNPDCYPHPVTRIQLLETHISYVLLTGSYAYKLKKKLDLGFVDYSTLERRRWCCEEEVRLNRRLAPQIYLEVLPIVGSPEAPIFGREGGPAIEYVVKMVQFSPEDQLDRLLAQGALPRNQIDALAHRVAAFHQTIPTVLAKSPYGTPAAVLKPMVENFHHLRRLLRSPADRTRLKVLETWSRTQHELLSPRIATRRVRGFVRECHGDMHLGNVALVNGEVTVFDGIEFNPYLRWIDTMSEVAFLTMDLEDRNASGQAARFLDLYLEDTGDYAGLALLRFYQAYRAMVRAKVSAIRLGQGDLDAAERAMVRAQCRTYLNLARRYTRTSPRLLIIAHGPSGVGKTTLTNHLLERLGAVRIRSDVERKRLFGLAPLARSGSKQFEGIYTAEANQRTYQRIEHLAAEVLAAGFPVIVEATFLKRRGRDAMRTLAARENAVFVLLDLRATPATLRARLEERQRLGTDASEAGVAVLEHQLATADPLTVEEMDEVIVVDTESKVDMDDLAAQLQARYDHPPSQDKK